MGGTYHGGSTLIGRGGYWPGDGYDRPRKPVKPKKPTAAEIKKMRLELLGIIINSIINGKCIEKIPKRFRPVFSIEVKDKGGGRSWARIQPEFSELISKKRAAKENRDDKKKARLLNDSGIVDDKKSKPNSSVKEQIPVENEISLEDALNNLERRVRVSHQKILELQELIAKDHKHIRKIKQVLRSRK